MQFQNEQDIYGRMLVLTGNPIFNNLRNAVDNYNADFTDALSWGQLKSKRWLVSELEKINEPLGTVFLCAGWYATLASMLFNSKLDIDKMRSFDIDESCLEIADCMNKESVKDNWKFKAITQDIYDINYKEHTWQAWSKANNRLSRPITDVPNTIINTSCEHLEEFDKWYNSIPKGKLVVLQTNNFLEIPDHVNCSNTLEEFSDSAPMSLILYEGELELNKYTRFMKIGLR